MKRMKISGYILMSVWIWASLSILSWAEEGAKRPFYEYPGNYRDNVNGLKEKFKESFGYELLDLDEEWRPEEIERMQRAFAELPPSFYKLPDLKGFYRISRIQVNLEGRATPPNENETDDVKGATFPTFLLVYRHEGSVYEINVGEDPPRIEFYTPLFYEEEADFRNIVHHEMGHAFDVTQGFLSFSKEWIDLSRFRILNLPALDGKEKDDYLYTFLNDPEVDNYAPVSTRHLPTYSRSNMQEDFANSVAAYVQYPYFQYTHPARYEFLKKYVFRGQEYFPAAPDAKGDPVSRILADLDAGLKENDWDKVMNVAVEVSRSYFPDLEKKIVEGFEKKRAGDSSPETAYRLGVVSCFLLDPGALTFRQNLIREGLVSLEQLLKNSRCHQMARQNFDRMMAQMPPLNVYFFRNDGKDEIQFLDPVLRVAQARGYVTRYHWKVYLEENPDVILLEGDETLTQGGNGSVRLVLKDNQGKVVALPAESKLVLELTALRAHRETFKRFPSQPVKVGFVVKPWLDYFGPKDTSLKVVYPFSQSLLEKRH